MKKIAVALTFLAALPLAAAAQVSKEDLKKLTAAGISDDVILSYVRANGGVARLSAEDIIELKQAGASEKVLSVVLGTPAAPAKATPAASAPPPQYSPDYAPSDTYAVPSSTYVYDSTPYYYTPSVSYAIGIGGYFGGYYPYYGYNPRYYSNYCYPRTYGFNGYYYPRFSAGFSTSRGFAGVSSYRTRR